MNGGPMKVAPRHFSLSPAPGLGPLHPPLRLPCPVGRGGGCHRGAQALRHFATAGKGKLWSSAATHRDAPPLRHRSAVGKGKA